ncbi:helix-turn-helix domain-containing protein [Streptomyces sp. R44]|uniref:Helix-turn-helix domain-containing protein n=1 Tax=Streptomyces sp. R44 TaxID=3238633 RepID=A0AB39SU99_9ACTN
MGESVAGRLFSALDAFEGGGPAALRLTDIAARTGLPAPTALRLLRELVAWGGLERGADGTYRLGIRLRVLGAAAPCPRGLLDAALPALRALSARTPGTRWSPRAFSPAGSLGPGQPVSRPVRRSSGGVR